MQDTPWLHGHVVAVVARVLYSPSRPLVTRRRRRITRVRITATWHCIAAKPRAVRGDPIDRDKVIGIAGPGGAGGAGSFNIVTSVLIIIYALGSARPRPAGAARGPYSGRELDIHKEPAKTISFLAVRVAALTGAATPSRPGVPASRVHNGNHPVLFVCRMCCICMLPLFFPPSSSSSLLPPPRAPARACMSRADAETYFDSLYSRIINL